MFRRSIFVAIVTTALIVLSITPSTQALGGSAFGSGWTARVIPVGTGQFGGFIGLADLDAFGGVFTYGTSQWTNGRLKLAFIDAGDLTVAFGGDFQWQFLSVEATKGTDPFDAAVGGLLELNESSTAVGAFLNGSYPFLLKGGSSISPYARLDGTILFFDGNSDLDFGFHAGAEWDVPKFGNFWAEFQLDGNDGIFLGVDFDVL